jgi:hypothetical protein
VCGRACASALSRMRWGRQSAPSPKSKQDKNRGGRKLHEHTPRDLHCKTPLGGGSGIFWRTQSYERDPGSSTSAIVASEEKVPADHRRNARSAEWLRRRIA